VKMPAAVVGVVEAEQVSSPVLLSMLGRQFDNYRKRHDDALEI
jgi:hypothetical protein